MAPPPPTALPTDSQPLQAPAPRLLLQPQLLQLRLLWRRLLLRPLRRPLYRCPAGRRHRPPCRLPR